MPQQSVGISQTLGRGREGDFLPRVKKKKMAARGELLTRRSISGEGREEACVPGGRQGLRRAGFPEAVGCGKRCG